MGAQSTLRYGFCGTQGYDSSGRGPLEKSNLDPSGFAPGVPTSPYRAYSVYPTAATPASLAAAQEPSAGGSFGVTLTAGTNVVQRVLNINGLNVITYDITAQGAPALTYPLNGSDIPDVLERSVSVTGLSSSVSSQLVTVTGYDMFLQPVTCTFQGPLGTATTNSYKTFSYVSTVTYGADPGANISVGVGDVYGFPVAVYNFDQLLDLYWNNTSVANSPNGFQPADQTQPTTPLTGNVRGSYTLQTGFSNGTTALTAHIYIPNPNNMNAAYGYRP